MRLRLLAPALLLALAAGCDDSGSKKPAADGKEKGGSIIGQKTQEVLPLDQALQKEEGAHVGETTISASDPLTQASEAYKNVMPKAVADQVGYAIQMRNASNIADPKPLTFDEFMAEIIKPGQPDGIQLPVLPSYMAWAWDEANQKLVTVVYPKTQQRTLDSMPGRSEKVR
jgi:hypothetical protein